MLWFFLWENHPMLFLVWLVKSLSVSWRFPPPPCQELRDGVTLIVRSRAAALCGAQAGTHGILEDQWLSDQWMAGWLVVWNMFFFPYIGKNNPNWLIFLRGVETTNQQKWLEFSWLKVESKAVKGNGKGPTKGSQARLGSSWVGYGEVRVGNIVLGPFLNRNKHTIKRRPQIIGKLLYH